MRIILTEQCKSLTGSLGQGFGYAIVKRKNGFYSQRSNHKEFVPPDGHWRFIVACAELAQNKLHIADIRVAYTEFFDAIKEMGALHKIPAFYGWNSGAFLNAREVLKLKDQYGL